MKTSIRYAREKDKTHCDDGFNNRFKPLYDGIFNIKGFLGLSSFKISVYVFKILIY